MSYNVYWYRSSSANSLSHTHTLTEKASTKCIIQASEGSDLQIGPVIGKGFPIEQEFFG